MACISNYIHEFLLGVQYVQFNQIQLKMLIVQQIKWHKTDTCRHVHTHIYTCIHTRTCVHIYAYKHFMITSPRGSLMYHFVNHKCFNHCSSFLIHFMQHCVILKHVIRVQPSFALCLRISTHYLSIFIQLLLSQGINMLVLTILLQLYLDSRLDTWLQWIEQRQLQDETRNIYVLGFGPDLY